MGASFARQAGKRLVTINAKNLAKMSNRNHICKSVAKTALMDAFRRRSVAFEGVRFSTNCVESRSFLHDVRFTALADLLATSGSTSMSRDFFFSRIVECLLRKIVNIWLSIMFVWLIVGPVFAGQEVHAHDQLTTVTGIYEGRASADVIYAFEVDGLRRTFRCTFCPFYLTEANRGDYMKLRINKSIIEEIIMPNGITLNERSLGSRRVLWSIDVMLIISLTMMIIKYIIDRN
jgi:hypothetical protein